MSKRLGSSIRLVVSAGSFTNSNRMEARLPEDKLARIRQLLDSFTDRRSARLLDL